MKHGQHAKKTAAKGQPKTKTGGLMHSTGGSIKSTRAKKGGK